MTDRQITLDKQIAYAKRWVDFYDKFIPELQSKIEESEGLERLRFEQELLQAEGNAEAKREYLEKFEHDKKVQQEMLAAQYEQARQIEKDLLKAGERVISIPPPVLIKEDKLRVNGLLGKLKAEKTLRKMSHPEYVNTMRELKGLVEKYLKQ